VCTVSGSGFSRAGAYEALPVPSYTQRMKSVSAWGDAGLAHTTSIHFSLKPRVCALNLSIRNNTNRSMPFLEKDSLTRFMTTQARIICRSEGRV
jgi:hypothetical protein